MKYLILIGLIWLNTDPFKISKINSVKSEAKNAFQAGDYATAVSKYKYLIDSMGVAEDEVTLNLAHAYYLQKDTANAFPTYQSLTQSSSSKISSKAFNQVALMLNQRGKPEQALQHFKIALKADPTNEEARHNYEMLKKKLDQKKKQDEQKKNDQDKNQEPSEFAKRLKAQADKLVAEKRYSDAFNLMMNGMKQDKTVSSYQKYIDRIKDVVEIDK
jgi:Ca-activated chloride channel family protein